MNQKKSIEKYSNLKYLNVRDKVYLDKVAKRLRKLPAHIIAKLHTWIRAVEFVGLREVRKTPGYHDEPLGGIRIGQRSIRLSRSYRAIYTEESDGKINIIIVEEISKHEY